MKVLIAISSKQYSGPTLDVGMNIARTLKASTTIVDVGEKISEFSLKDVDMVNELMESWEIDRPGVDVLAWAYDYLKKNKFITISDESKNTPQHSLVESSAGRVEILLKGNKIKDLNLILRNGDIINELRNEVQSYRYDLTIIGGSGKRNVAHDLVQYIDSSIFIVNNFNLSQKYKILLAVDDSPGTNKAIKYGVRVAQAFDNEVEILTVSKNKNISTGSAKAIKRAEVMLRRTGIIFEKKIEIGDPVNIILKNAEENRIIIMGASTQSPLTKFFLGSKPLSVIKKCNCPILIVR